MPRDKLHSSEDRDATDVYWKPLYGDSEARYRAGEQRSQGTIQYCVCYLVIAVAFDIAYRPLARR